MLVRNLFVSDLDSVHPLVAFLVRHHVDSGSRERGEEPVPFVRGPDVQPTGQRIDRRIVNHTRTRDKQAIRSVQAAANAQIRGAGGVVLVPPVRFSIWVNAVLLSVPALDAFTSHAFTELPPTSLSRPAPPSIFPESMLSRAVKVNVSTPVPPVKPLMFVNPPFTPVTVPLPAKRTMPAELAWVWRVTVAGGMVAVFVPDPAGSPLSRAVYVNEVLTQNHLRQDGLILLPFSCATSVPPT